MFARTMVLCICGAVLMILGGTADAAFESNTNSESAILKDLFAGRTVARFQIALPSAELRKLSRQEWNGHRRPFALATVTEGGAVYTNVEVHLKGGAGSYRPVEDNPGLTLNFEKYAPGQSFHGLKKFSLNNSVQDPTFLNEKICRELFNAAGSPTPRAAFALVELNGRKLGVHVLTEGANKQFLRHYFENVHGNLYQTHGNQEITDRLDVNSGDDPGNDSGLRALARAVSRNDPALRWNALEQTLDVDRFASFMGLEIMLCHWDGYCMNQNNYRLFHDLNSNKIVFIAHGLDQMFGTGTMRLAGERSSADCPIFPEWHGAVAEAVMSTPQGRRLYLVRLGQLYTNLFKVEALCQRVDELSGVVSNALAESGMRAVRQYQRRIDALKEHIRERDQSMAQQLANAFRPHDPQTFSAVHLTGWSQRIQEGRPELDHASAGPRPQLLHIAAVNGKAAGSWRTRISLEPGRYRFEGQVRVEGVEPGDAGAGARLRISGGRAPRQMSGSSDWRPFVYEFQVGQTRDIELVCELRAAQGEAWFDADTLQLVRME